MRRLATFLFLVSLMPLTSSAPKAAGDNWIEFKNAWGRGGQFVDASSIQSNPDDPEEFSAYVTDDFQRVYVLRVWCKRWQFSRKAVADPNAFPPPAPIPPKGSDLNAAQIICVKANK